MRSAVRGQACGGEFAAREIVLEALDLLLLAIHEVDVVAEEEVQVFHVVARQLQLDGIELKQQIVAEGADQRQPRRERMMEFIEQRAQNGKRRGLLAALFFGEQAPAEASDVPFRAPPSLTKLSQCGCGASSGSRICVEHLAARD